MLAAAIGALDLMNMRPVEAASEMVHDQQKVDLPGIALATLRAWSLSVMERSEIASLFSRQAPKDSERAPSVLAKAKGTNATLTASIARTQGVAVAMLAPSRNSTTRVLPETPPLQIASLGPVPLPSETKPKSLTATSLELLPVLSVLPPPAPGVPPPSPIERLHLDGKSLAQAPNAASPMRSISKRATNRTRARSRSRRS